MLPWSGGGRVRSWVGWYVIGVFFWTKSKAMLSWLIERIAIILLNKVKLMFIHLANIEDKLINLNRC